MTSVFPCESTNPGARLGPCQRRSRLGLCQRRSSARLNQALYALTQLGAKIHIQSLYPLKMIRLDSSASAGSSARLDLVARLQMLGQILVARKKDISRLGSDGAGIVACGAGKRRPALSKPPHPQPLRIPSLPGFVGDSYVPRRWDQKSQRILDTPPWFFLCSTRVP